MMSCSSRSQLQLKLLLLISAGRRLFFAFASDEFNSEISKRIQENLEHFMAKPMEASHLTASYFEVKGFPNNLRAPDRAAALKYLYSQVEALGANAFYGLEDGTFYGYNNNLKTATFREPGESGYLISKSKTQTADPSYKHWISCVNATSGEPLNCQMNDGGTYISWSEGTDVSVLVPCDHTYQQIEEDCSLLEHATTFDLERCLYNVKYCRTYEIRQANFSRIAAAADGDMTLGYIARNYHCVDKFGQITEDRGRTLLDRQTQEYGDCTFGDGTTLVERGGLAGDYAYCGGTSCNGTFLGGFRSRDYDPRWRGWYQDARATLKAKWSDPFPFFSDLNMGLMYYEPFFSIDDKGRRVFEGVVEIDVLLSTISDWLLEAYGDKSDTYVVIFEDKAPHYVIASSTGSKAAKQVLSSDNSQPCPSSFLDGEIAFAECEAIRVSMQAIDIKTEPGDLILQAAFDRLEAEGFPTEKLVPLKHEDKAYVAQSQMYELPDANIRWQVVIVLPMKRSPSDSIVAGDALFLVLCLVAGIGFLACTTLFFLCYSKRKERAFVYADWRLMAAFVGGCCCYNLSSFTLVGEATDGLCMARMWSLSIGFVLALSPLFVKVWRIYALVGQGTSFQRRTISNAEAAVRVLPMLLIQVVILLIFTFVDPPLKTKVLDIDYLAIAVQPTYYILCEHNSYAYYITEVAFGGIVTLLGCYLAFKSRNVGGELGESRPLAMAMYNVAFGGTIIVAILLAVEMDRDAEYLMVAIGVFWGTVVSASLFVLPRYYQAAKGDINRVTRSSRFWSRRRSSNASQQSLPSKRSKVFVSGLNLNSAHLNVEDRPQSGVQSNENSSNPNLTEEPPPERQEQSQPHPLKASVP